MRKFCYRIPGRVFHLIISGLFILSTAFWGWHCAGSRSPAPEIIRVKGSDTMLILTRLWAEEYMKTHARVSVYAQGGGTAIGIKALINGEADICAASRPLRPEEISQLAERYQAIGISFLVAKDALSIYLHPDNPLNDLTVKQLKEIFTGKVTNWSEVGGRDEEIRVITRTPNSGTYLYFQEHVLEEAPYSSSAKMVSTTTAVVDTVARNPRAIGYGGIAYGRNRVVHSRVNGIPALEESIRYNLYPITRYLYLYTINKPTGPPKEFIDWILSNEGQRIVKRAGYIPLWEISE